MAINESDFRADFQSEDFERTAPGRVALSRKRKEQLDRLTNLQVQIDRVAADLLALDLEGGESSITSHTGLTDIGTKTHTQIETDLATNASGIATNAADIGTNASAISGNDTDIATNSAGIAANVIDISTNAAGVAANLAAVSSNDTDIATNASGVSANAADIATNVTAIGAKLPLAGGALTGPVTTTSTFDGVDVAVQDAAHVAHAADTSIHAEETVLKDRANHTGTQALSTISDSGALAALDTVDTAQIDDEAVTLAKMAHMATDSFLGRDTESPGDVEVLTATAARGILNVEDGSTADQTDAEIYTAWKNDHYGTSFPGSPSTGDTFYRTDLLCEFQRTSSGKWLSTGPEIPLVFSKAGSLAATQYLLIGGMNPNSLTEGIYPLYTYTLTGLTFATSTTTSVGDAFNVRSGVTDKYTYGPTSGVTQEVLTGLDSDLTGTESIKVYARALSSSLTDACITLWLRRRET